MSFVVNQISLNEHDGRHGSYGARQSGIESRSPTNSGHIYSPDIRLLCLMPFQSVMKRRIH